MVDEDLIGDVNRGGVKPKIVVGWGSLVVFLLMVLGLLVVIGLIFYQKGVDSVPVSNFSVNDSYNLGYSTGYNSGVGYAVNATINSLLYYARNCSVATINYSSQVFGFVDATCISRLQNVS
jgi:hypothetical protein